MSGLALVSICVALVELVAVEQRHVDHVEEQFFFQYRLEGRSAEMWYIFQSLIYTTPMYLLYEAIHFGFCLRTPAPERTSTIPAVAAVLSISAGLRCDVYSRNATSRMP